ERRHEAARFAAIWERRLDPGGAAVGDPQPAAGADLVALGMAAEIVVVVEDENLRRPVYSRAVEVRRREPTDAATDHDEIVCFLRVERLAGALPESTVS